MEPPIPVLSGPPIFPDIKRGRQALLLSLAALGLFLVAIVLGVLDSVKTYKVSPSNEKAIDIFMTGLMLVSVLPSSAGILLGFKARRSASGKAALILGGFAWILWLLVAILVTKFGI